MGQNLYPKPVAPAAASMIVAESLSYHAIAASSTKTGLGTAGGALGDTLERIIYTPATTAAGIVEIYDGSGNAIVLFEGGGTTALVDLRPVTIELGVKSVSGGWQVTTGANVSVVAVGVFS